MELLWVVVAVVMLEVGEIIGEEVVVEMVVSNLFGVGQVGLKSGPDQDVIP